MTTSQIKAKLLERAIKRLSKQSGFAVDPNSRTVNGCKYRIEVEGETRCCVAGSLIDDDKYDPAIENLFADTGPVFSSIRASNPDLDLDEESAQFLSSLQMGHDGVAKQEQGDFGGYLASLRKQLDKLQSVDG